MSCTRCSGPVVVCSGESARTRITHGARARCVAACTYDFNTLQAPQRGACRRVRMSSKACYRPSAVRSGEVVRPLTGHGAPARCVAASTNELNSLQARERGAFKRVRATSSGSFYLCAARKSRPRPAGRINATRNRNVGNRPFNG